MSLGKDSNKFCFLSHEMLFQLKKKINTTMYNVHSNTYEIKLFFAVIFLLIAFLKLLQIQITNSIIWVKNVQVCISEDINSPCLPSVFMKAPYTSNAVVIYVYYNSIFWASISSPAHNNLEYLHNLPLIWNAFKGIYIISL